MSEIIFERKWAMPNKWTFGIKLISDLLFEEMKGEEWYDPFCGNSRLAKYLNDIEYGGEDALIWLKKIKNEVADGVLYDPPYSITQARLYGKKEFASMKYWSDCKNEIARIIKSGGKVICFGWNSMGLGKNRGFKMKKILLVAHGGSRNDTICTIEIKK